MSRWLRFDRRTIRWASLALIGAVLPLLVWSRGGVALDDGRGPFRADGILAASRDHVAICVQGLDGASFDLTTAVEHVRTVVQRVQRQPTWSLLRIPGDPAIVAYGCPSPPVLQSSARDLGRTLRLVSTKYVSEASQFRLFIFVMRPIDVQYIFDTDHIYYRTAIEESICATAATESGRRCEGVTLGVYLTDQEINDLAALEYAIKRGLNLTGPPDDLPTDRNVVPAPLPTRSPSPQALTAHWFPDDHVSVGLLPQP